MRTFNIEEREKIDTFIKDCRVCFVAVATGDMPYVLPMNFAHDGDVIILHSAQYGRMWDMLKANPRACITWSKGEGLAWQNERVGCSYRMISTSAIVEGKAEFVDNYAEKERCLHVLMAQYSNLEFKFNKPAVDNVGIIKVHIEKISAKEFGVKTAARRKKQVSKPDSEKLSNSEGNSIQ